MLLETGKQHKGLVPLNILIMFWAREYNRNSNDKMNTNTDFTAKTTEFYSSLGFQYVPKNVRVYVGDNDGTAVGNAVQTASGYLGKGI